MDWSIVLTCVFIVLARIADVSLGTIRMMFLMQGRRILAPVLGFFELLIWIYAVSAVIAGGLDNPAYAIAYAMGFALGTYIGLKVEGWIALGEQVVRVFTHNGEGVAFALREQGYRCTIFEGKGRDGPISLLYLKVPRRQVAELAAKVRKISPHCFYVVEDIRQASSPDLGVVQPTGWRATLKKK